MNSLVERRIDSHTQMLVEVGVRLCRSQGLDYARQFLEDVHVPQSIIERVLELDPQSSSDARIRHVRYQNICPATQ